jgi:hypothetical protein
MGGRAWTLSVVLDDIKNSLGENKDFADDVIDNNDVLTPSWTTLFVLNGWDNRYSRQSVLGVLAHEVAHRILRHNEQRVAWGLQAAGVPVESLEDIEEVLQTLKSQEEKLSQKELVQRLFQSTKRANLTDIISIEKKLSKKESVQRLFQSMKKANLTDIISIRERLESTVTQHLPDLREQEFEADLFTLRIPEYARGLRDGFVQLLNHCRKKMPCRHDEDGLTHPAMSRRIDRLTNAICETYPEQNRDLC